MRLVKFLWTSSSHYFTGRLFLKEYYHIYRNYWWLVKGQVLSNFFIHIKRFIHIHIYFPCSNYMNLPYILTFDPPNDYFATNFKIWPLLH